VNQDEQRSVGDAFWPIKKGALFNAPI